MNKANAHVPDVGASDETPRHVAAVGGRMEAIVR